MGGAGAIADLLTGSGSAAAQDVCADALRWLVPAAIAHLFAGLAASGLAALDDYATAALGYALGSTAALTMILTRVDDDGIAALWWGVALNGAISLAVPVVGLAWRALRARMPAGAVRPTGPPLRSRLGIFATAAALPIALQLLYVVCLPFAGHVEPGAVTSFGYAYLAAASLVSITAFSIGLVSSVPLTRIGLGEGAVARHVTSSAWVALTLIGAAVGAFAVAGGAIIEQVLGDAYGGDIGEEVSRLIVVLSPWMVVSVGVNVSFPLAFVAERLRALPVIGAAALAAQVVLAWICSELFELDGLAVALALSTGARARGVAPRARRSGCRLARDRASRCRRGGADRGCVPAGRTSPRDGRSRRRRERGLRRARRALATAPTHGVVGLPAGVALAAAR